MNQYLRQRIYQFTNWTIECVVCGKRNEILLITPNINTPILRITIKMNNYFGIWFDSVQSYSDHVLMNLDWKYFCTLYVRLHLALTINLKCPQHHSIFACIHKPRPFIQPTQSFSIVDVICRDHWRCHSLMWCQPQKWNTQTHTKKANPIQSIIFDFIY